MKKFTDILKLSGILICLALLLMFAFFDIVDLVIPGDFPDWLYVTELVVWAIFGVFALVMYIRKRRKHKK